jgi:N-acetylglucosamine kinase-like BadF-type ATPase
MTVRPFAGAATTLFVATDANGQIVLQGGNGTATVTVDAATTALFTPGRYVYDFVYDSGETVTTVLNGQFIVIPGVTV